MYTFIYFTSLVFKLLQKQFSQNLQFCEGGTILNQTFAQGVYEFQIKKITWEGAKKSNKTSTQCKRESYEENLK